MACEPLLPWMKQLVSRIPSEPESIIEDELVYVIGDFCREAHPWRDLISDLNIVSGVADIPTNPVDSRTRCIAILNVYYNNQSLWQYTTPQPLIPDGTPIGYTCLAPDTITLIPPPVAAESGAIKALVSLAPTDPRKWLPSLFEVQHFEAILDGTLGRFYNQPTKPFSDDKLARYHLRRYRAKTREASDMAGRGYTTGGADWAFPRFGV